MMIEMALAVNPASRQEVHDRGMIYFLLRRYAEARTDLRQYLSVSPPDDPQARDAKAMLHRIRALHN
jgi:regulator of sirC expression with transglutaminase-like and TPR domain